MRLHLLQALKLLLLVWPPLHLLLAGWLGFNSWKLAGWGMYASPRPSHTELYLLELGQVFESAQEPAPVSNAGLRALRVLPQAAELRQALDEAGLRLPALVLYRTPRLHLSQRTAGSQVRVFLVSEQSLSSWVERDYGSWSQLRRRLHERLARAGYPGPSAKAAE